MERQAQACQKSSKESRARTPRMHSKFATHASWSCWDLGSKGCFLCCAQPHTCLTAPNCSSATPKFISKDYLDSMFVAVHLVCLSPNTTGLLHPQPCHLPAASPSPTWHSHFRGGFPLRRVQVLSCKINSAPPSMIWPQ